MCSLEINIQSFQTNSKIVFNSGLDRFLVVIIAFLSIDELVFAYFTSF